MGVRGRHLTYKDLNDKKKEERVTYEAENNLDFRLGTGALRGTNIAFEGDMAALTRLSEKDYELRIFQIGTPIFLELQKYAINFIGHMGKRYGYIDNETFNKILKKYHYK